VRAAAAGAALVAAIAACSSSSSSGPPGDAGSSIGDQGDASLDASGASSEADGFAWTTGAGGMDAATGSDGAPLTTADGALPADRFVTGVVSFEPGPCAGFGAGSMPQVVEGPPVGGGTDHGSTDVVSLGNGGTIVVSFGPNAIVDGPGPDFIVFENPFWVASDSNDIYAEPGEVSVSDDGVTWQVFPCTPTVDPNSPHATGVAPPYGSCAGWHVVYSNPINGISPVDPSVSGGDAFDLADLGVKHARYVRIVDKTLESCPDDGGGANDNGFDLDAVSIVNPELP
jgi:hypothetical protein